MLGAGIVAAAPRRSVLAAIITVCALAAALRVVDWVTATPMAPWLREGTSLVALLCLAALIALHVFGPGEATVDRILGAVALYLLLGVLWANAYEWVAIENPAAFVGQPGGAPGHARRFYFSFVTLTTVGYGDITPASDGARALAIVEALIGQLYPAIVLARLVSDVSSRK